MTKETVSIRVDPKIWKEARLFAVKSNLKVGEFVESAIKEKISKK
ncbi:Uncharacterised protein [uncultured archaeon]|nr:Uncharacterised protein [uncultured archaeon]